MMSCILSQLNILCSNLVKPCYTKRTINPLFTVHTLGPWAILRVIQRIGFHRRGVIHTSKHSLLHLVYETCFEFYRN